MNKFQFLRYNDFIIEYAKFGNGNQILLCLHGFGRHASDFLPLEKLLENSFTCIAINLFHHGNSKLLKPENTFSKSDLIAIIQQLCVHEKIPRFSLLAYSLGGKVALSIAESLPEKVNELFLFAPDGIKANPWYQFASQTFIGQSLNRINIHQPWIFTTLLQLSRWFNWASERQIEFAMRQMDSKAKRRNVFQIWKTYRLIQPQLPSLKHQLESHKIPCHFFVGKFDGIIPIQPILSFCETSPVCNIQLLHTGHIIPIEKIAHEINKIQ